MVEFKVKEMTVTIKYDDDGLVLTIFPLVPRGIDNLYTYRRLVFYDSTRWKDDFEYCSYTETRAKNVTESGKISVRPWSGSGDNDSLLIVSRCNSCRSEEYPIRKNLTAKAREEYCAAIIQHPRVRELIDFIRDGLNTAAPCSLENQQRYKEMMALSEMAISPEIKSHVEEIFTLYNLQQQYFDLPNESTKRTKAPQT